VALGTLGVEEEYLLLDADSGVLRPVNELVLRDAEPSMGDTVHSELKRSQVEVSTPVCTSLEEVATELRALRRRLNEAAARHGCRLGAAGSHPSARWETQEVTPNERYLAMADEYQQTAAETLICGCHVHVGVDDLDLRIRVMNRIRPWLPTILALSANSPFWGGDDTGYASYRTMVFRRWPMTGMPQHFADNNDYEDAVDALVKAGAIEDATHLYWYARPSARFPTLEMRVADVCLTVEEAVAVAGLIAAAVEIARLDDERDRGADPTVRVRPEVLEAAVWRAARYGVSDRLIDVVAGDLRPADEVARGLLTTLRPALEDGGAWELVRDGVERILTDGNAADRQRAVYRRRGSLTDVALFIAEATGS
jgi:carboxylate-amine ligase